MNPCKMSYPRCWRDRAPGHAVLWRVLGLRHRLRHVRRLPLCLVRRHLPRHCRDVRPRAPHLGLWDAHLRQRIRCSYRYDIIKRKYFFKLSISMILANWFQFDWYLSEDKVHNIFPKVLRLRAGWLTTPGLRRTHSICPRRCCSPQQWSACWPG